MPHFEASESSPPFYSYSKREAVIASTATLSAVLAVLSLIDTHGIAKMIAVTTAVQTQPVKAFPAKSAWRLSG
eukprot:1897930-Amphidinium_carterae.1